MNESLEKLMMRRLDGEISPEEQLDLDRELLLDPEARRVFEEYQRLDALANAAIAHAVEESSSPFRVRAPSDRTTSIPARSYSRVWWCLPGALAAALVLLVVGQAMFFRVSNPDNAVRPGSGSLAGILVQDGETSGVNPRGVSRSGEWQPSMSDPVQRASYPGGRVWQNTDREITGFVGEDGTIYWLEVDRTRTVRSALEEGSVRLTSGDL